MIEDCITYRLVYDNHPIKGLSEKYKKIYLQGLGDLLCHVAQHNKNTQSVYDGICEDLLGYGFPEGWLNSNKMKNARNAQKLCRVGLKFFRMSRAFWWDFYRILIITGVPLNEFSRKKIDMACNAISKKYQSEVESFIMTQENPQRDVTPYIENLIADFKFHALPKKTFLIVGTMSAGKSTLINALVGVKIAQVKTTACTSEVTAIFNRAVDDGIYYSDGDNIKKCYEADLPEISSPAISKKFRGNLSSYRISLKDTPGVDFAYDHTHELKTEKELTDAEYDAIICVVNAPYMERNGEDQIISRVLSVKNKRIIFVLNQFDRFNPDDDSIEESLKQFQDYVKRKKSDASVVPFSAKAGFLLKKEVDNTLSKFEIIELKSLKEKLSSSFYDLGKYGTGIDSQEGNFFDRCGLTNLENIIKNV